jgi:hypothetical protein
LNKRKRVIRMKLHDWLALSNDARNDLVRRWQCELLGSFRHCTNKRCRRERWCAGSDPRVCKERLWKLKWSRKRAMPKTLRDALAKLEDVTYWRT